MRPPPWALTLLLGAVALGACLSVAGPQAPSAERPHRAEDPGVPPSTTAAAEASTAKPREPLVIFEGMCDASAAVPLGPATFAVASDEDNILRVYDATAGGPPLRAFDLSPALGLAGRKKVPELDIEGASRLGPWAVWLTSHGRSARGKVRAARFRLFATTLPATEGPVALAGRPYSDLLEDLLQHPPLAPFDLERAAQLPPKDPGGLNIEGLATTPSGTLLIGFRSPLPAGRALLVPLENPKGVIDGEERPRFGPPILLDLDGLGVRDILDWPGGFLVAAGPAQGEGASRLYTWTGDPQDRPTLVMTTDDLNTEALVRPDAQEAESHAVLLLSDDGTKRQDGTSCKNLPEPARSFRGLWIQGAPATQRTSAWRPGLYGEAAVSPPVPGPLAPAGPAGPRRR